MIRYCIKYDYTTGNSFGSKSYENEQFEVIWKNLDLAKENMKILADHYNSYCKYAEASSSEERNKILEEFTKKEWFTNKQYWEFSVLLKDDNGSKFQISIPWCGYFESLQALRIGVLDGILDTEIIF